MSEEEQNRFSLRKLSIGLASVLVGVSIFGTSQTVKADTVADQNTSTVTSNAQSSNTQENQNTAKLTLSSDNQVDNAKRNVTPTQENEQKQVQTENGQQDSVSKTQEATDSSNLDAEKSIVRTSSLQESNNQSNDHAEDNSQTQPQNSKKLAKKVLATNLIATPPTTNGGFDEATWGKLDVNEWQGSVQDGLYQLTNYTGDPNHVIVPNEADFEKAGKSTNGLQVGIASGTTHSLSLRPNQEQTIAFSKTNNQKVKAIGTDWSKAFSSNTGNTARLSKFDGSSLDVSKVTDMSAMFENDSINDLTSLADWDTSNVTDMSNMFYHNSISDLKPLANWDTSKVTDMSYMFVGNSISDLTPLTNWKTSKVTDMSAMFEGNSISDLTPLANWDTSKVTDMSKMFFGNKISDLTPLANWDTSKVTNMSWMFENNSIRDLTPLTNWKTSNVTDMSAMFEGNSISDLTPLANWDTSKVIDMSWMFVNNSIRDLTPLANWDVSKVTDMSDMFGGNIGGNSNTISNLTPLAKWDVSNVTNMRGMFIGNSISDLTPLTNWKTSKVTDMSKMFFGNKISDLTPLANWDTSKVTDMSYMFAGNFDLIDLRPIANWNISSITNNFNGFGFPGLASFSGLAALFFADTKLDLTNINNTPLMQGFLKTPDALLGATFITNNTDLVKAAVGQDLPTLTNTAKRTIVFHFPDGTSKTIGQTINYKAVAPVQINFNIKQIVKTYPVKESDWQLDTSKQNDAIVVNGQIRFKSVKIPHINGYKAYIVPNKSNSALFTVSFIAVPTENKPSTPVEATPSKPSAPTDNPNNSAWTNLDHKVVNTLNQSDSGWTMPENNSTYTVEVPDDATIDLSDLVIAQPVHARTRVKLAVTKHFKLSKKHSIKHLKHRKKAVKSFKKYRL